VAGGGAARAFGSAAVLWDANAAGGGAAKTLLGVPGYTAGSIRVAGGGAAKAFGVQNVGIVGFAHVAGGGAAAAPTIANHIGIANAAGGGAVTAVSSGHTGFGTAAAAGGGATRAVGSSPLPPSVVDHWIMGWPVNAEGAVIVHIVP
jgi:hypothetical protein